MRSDAIRVKTWPLGGETTLLALVLLMTSGCFSRVRPEVTGALGDRELEKAAEPELPYCQKVVEAQDGAPGITAAAAVEAALQYRGARDPRSGLCVLDTWLAAWPADPAREAELGEAMLENRRGDLCIDLQLYDSAEAAYLRAFEIARLQGREDEASLIANNLGLMFSIGLHTVYPEPPDGGPVDFVQAQRWFAVAQEKALAAGNQIRAIKSSNNAGMVAVNRGEIPTAVEHYENSARMAMELQDHSQRRKALASKAYALMIGLFLAQENNPEPTPDQEAELKATLKEIRQVLQQALDAAEEAGEPAARVCETFGRYSEACEPLLP